MLRIAHCRTAAAVLGFAVMPCVTGSVLCGCGSPTPEPVPPASSPASNSPASASPTQVSDPDDIPIKEADVTKPKDFADAVSRIETYRNTIRDEIAAGRPTKAHRGLDELDYVLKWLPGIAQESGIAKDLADKVGISAKAIQDAFNQVHSRIDDRKEPDYASVSASIDSSIEELKKIAAAPKGSETEKKP